MIVGASCTAELIQDDPGGLAEALGLPCPVIPLDLPVLPAQGKLRRGRDLPPDRPAPGQADGAHGADHLQPPRRHRASASATATT
jgi:hypothetical protein